MAHTHAHAHAHTHTHAIEEPHVETTPGLDLT